MNPKILLAFVGGALLASGIMYMALKPERHATPTLTASSQPIIVIPPAGPETPPPIAPLPEPAPVPVAAPKLRAAKLATTPEPAAEPDPVPPKQEIQPEPAPAPAASAPPENRVEAPAPAPPIPAPRPPLPEAHKVTVVAGTMLQVRVGETISTRKNKPGDTFLVTLAQPLVVDGFVIAEKGARCEGRIVEAELGGKVRGTSKLTVELTKLSTADGQHIRIRTASFDQVGQSGTKTNAAKVGIGAGLGAAIGAIAGGGKGAGIGAGVGGAAGAGDVLLTRGPDAVITVETRLSFRVSEDVVITERL